MPTMTTEGTNCKHVRNRSRDCPEKNHDAEKEKPNRPKEKNRRRRRQPSGISDVSRERTKGEKRGERRRRRRRAAKHERRDLLSRPLECVHTKKVAGRRFVVSCEAALITTHTRALPRIRIYARLSGIRPATHTATTTTTRHARRKKIADGTAPAPQASNRHHHHHGWLHHMRPAAYA